MEARIKMEEQKEKKRRAGIIISVIAVLIILSTLAVLNGQKTVTDNQQCCELICGQLNQQCRGWNLDTLECEYNYQRFGYPWITEIFTFEINPETKAQICEQGQLPPDANIQVLNESN